MDEFDKMLRAEVRAEFMRERGTAENAVWRRLVDAKRVSIGAKMHHGTCFVILNVVLIASMFVRASSIFA